MTTIYFIRHAKSDRTVRDGRIRPLTETGMVERTLVTEYLCDKKIDVVLSSPFKRAVDTVADFANKFGFNITTIEDFREQRSSSDIKDRGSEFFNYLKQQWSDFSHKMTDGESLLEVQERNIAALKDVITEYQNKNIVIGTHGIALSVIINYYDKTYGFEDLLAMADIMPWVVKMEFNGDSLVEMCKIDLFKPIIE